MHRDLHTLAIRKKRRFCIHKDLNADHSWNIIGPIVAMELGIPDYTPIPHCFDTNAYKIGHIFVPTSTQISCFRAVPVLKILGPVRDFVAPIETNSKWLDKEFHSVRTHGDKTNFQIVLERGKNQIMFTGHNYYFLSKGQDMSAPGNVKINRAAHADLLSAKWIGLITDVLVASVFELHIVKGLRARTLYLGGNRHTILFKYEIWKIDENGAVINSETKKIDCKWLPITIKYSDNILLNKFRSVDSV